MNTILEQINSTGKIFVEFALPMLVQSSVLILILLLTDFALRKKVRAVFRYGIWMLVLIKLVLPTSLSAPLSLGYFLGDGLAYVDISRTTTEPAQKAPAIVSPIIEPLRIEANSDTSAIAPTTPTIEPAVTGPLSPPIVPVVSLSWQGAVFLIWLAVVMAMGLLLLQRAIFVRGLVAQAKEANGFMDDMLESCRRSMVVKRKIGLKVSPNTASPAVCGLFRPVILVPKKLTSSLNSGQLRAVLLHELAHIRRSDLWVNLAQTVLQIIYFYNPLLWLANCVIRRVREQAVDEMVLVTMGEKARQYPQTLVDVAKLAFKRPVLSLRLIGVVESKSALAQRIKHILNRPMPKKVKLGIIGLVVVIIIGAVLLPMASSMSGQPELIIKGVVKDAQTNEPIAGARVFDDGYGPEPIWEQIRSDQRCQWGAITNSAGRYSFLTWPEHHSIKVEAPGYIAQRRSLYKGHFVINTKDQEIFDFTLEPENISDSSEFKATLPNGVAVELVGLCEHPSRGKQWWQPDGKIIENDFRPYAFKELRSLRLPLNQQENKILELAVIITDSSNRNIGIICSGAKRTFVNCRNNVWGRTFEVGKELGVKDFKIGVAAGAWETLASSASKFGRRRIKTQDIVFTEAYNNQEGYAVVIVTHKKDIEKENWRVVAIDQEGKTHEADLYQTQAIGEFEQDMFHFKRLRSDQIRRFEFQTRPYQWIEFKNVVLQPGVKTDVQVEGEVKGGGLTVFESYFSDDAEAGKKLDEYWENRKKMKLSPEEFFELFQNGLRRCTAQHKSNFLMQHIGGEYIWHKEPDDPRAVDIVYHASFSPEYKYYAVYSGLSVANPKSERVLKRLVDLAMEPHQLGRVIWGVKQSKQEDRFMILLEPYLQGSDPGKRERADVVVRAFKGEIDAGRWEREWNQQQKTERTIREFGEDLPRIKKAFLTGTSSERLEVIKFIRKNLLSLGHDQSFIRALDICAQDDDSNVRSGIASILGGNYIWGKEIQSKEVIKILLSLSHDENRDVRYNAVYYGLSVIKEKNKEVIERLVELALNDHENNLYGRIVWGLGGPTRADRELIEQVLAEKGSEATSDQHRTASLYFLYKELFSKEPPTVWGLKKAASHYENFFSIYLAAQEPFQPENTDELWQELSRILPEELRVQGFPDLKPDNVVIWIKVHGKKAHEAVVRLIKENTKLRFKSSTPLPPPMILFLEEPQSIKHLKKVYEWPKNYRQGKHSWEVVENKKKLSFGSVVLEPSGFKKTLPNGVTVELVGICEHPSEGKRWWKPDGTELSKEIRVRTRGRVSASGRPYTVAAKVNMPEDATFELGRIKGATGTLSLEAVDSEGRPISNMWAWMVYIDEKLTATSIQLGAAAGPWKTRAKNRSKGGMSTAGIVFSKAYESDEGVRIIVADEHLDLDYRIAAIDTQGKQHLFHQRGGSAGKVRQTTAVFHDIKLNQIEYFLFQTRPYQWATFRNVSLRPSVKTDVQVRAGEQVSPSTSLRTGSGAGEESNGPQWVSSDWPNASRNDYALKFNGSSSYVKIPASPSLDIRNSLSLSAWVKNDGDNDGQIIWRGDNQVGKDPYQLHVENNRMKFRLNPLGGNVTYNAESRETVDNNWHLWTATYDSEAKTMYLYKDGQLESTAEAPVGFNYDTSKMWNVIGAVDFGNWQHFKGTIDEVRIWNRALKPQEIQRATYGTYKINDRNLVAYWNFNEAEGNTIHDISPNNNLGQLHTWTGRIGYISPLRQLQTPSSSAKTVESKFSKEHWQQFDGAGDYVEVLDNPSLDLTGPLTLEAWIHFEAGGTDNPRIISKGWEVRTGYEFALYGTGTRRRLAFLAKNIGHTVSNSLLSANKWYHVAVTYDGLEVKLFINGQEDQSHRVSGVIAVNIVNLNIGRNSQTFGDKYKGRIAEVRIWNIARTTDEIQRDMQKKLKGSERGLFACWLFGRESGEIVRDISSNGNDARIIGSSSASKLNFKPDVQVEEEGLADNSGIKEQVLQGRYGVGGTVYDPVPHTWWEDYFSKFEAIESEEEFDKFFKSSEPSPELAAAAGVTVTLQGPSLTKKTVTDAEGNYKFNVVPGYSYVLSCEKTVTSTRTGQKQTALAKKGDVDFRSGVLGRKVDLRLCTDYVVVTGRIINPHGESIAGAKVTAILDVHDVAYQQYLENHEAPTWSVISKADGSYELPVIHSPNYFSLAGQLQAEGSIAWCENVNIHVEADGFVQSREQITKVPLVTEEALKLARRFLEVLSRVSQRAGGPGYQESKDRTFPSSNGNMITGIDIVLEQTVTDVQVEVEKPNVLRVPSDKYPTILSAIAAANSGDKIVISNHRQSRWYEEVH